MVRVGLIGFGLAGQAFHAPVIRGVPGMELACILERHGSNAEAKYPEVRVARTLDEMLSDKSINLCVVATPNDSHYSYTKACLQAGRDVVVDKPFTPTMAEAEQLVRLAADRGRLVTVYQDRRWDGAFLTVKKLVSSGALGTVAEYESRFDRFRLETKPSAWREQAEFPAAGVLWDLGPHLIDGALVLFGEPETICAAALCQRENSKIDDAFDVIMQYPRTRATLRARIIAYASGPSPADSWDGRIVHQVRNGSTRRNPARSQLSGRAELGFGLGAGTGRTLGDSEPCERGASQSTNRARRLSRVLRQRARCDREGDSVGRDARTSIAHDARASAGAQEQPGRSESPVDGSAGVNARLSKTESYIGTGFRGRGRPRHIYPFITFWNAA